MAITGGPPQRPLLYGLSHATFFLHAHLNGSVLRQGQGTAGVVLEVKWGASSSWVREGIRCNGVTVSA